MTLNHKHNPKSSIVPLSLLGFLILFLVAYHLLGLPEGDELLRLFETYLRRYGYAIVFAAAFLEAIPPLNFYFPGSAVIIVSVALSRDGPLNVFGVLLAAATGFFVSFIFDFFVGKHGLQWIVSRTCFGPALDRAQAKVENHGPRWIWLANIHPNIGALAAMSCGILKIRLRTYVVYSATSLVFWVSAWGAAAYFGGRTMLRWLDLRLIIPLLLVWAAVQFCRNRRKRRQSQKMTGAVHVNDN